MDYNFFAVEGDDDFLALFPFEFLDHFYGQSDRQAAPAHPGDFSDIFIL